MQEKAFWQAIVQNDCAVPAGYTANTLTPELLTLLGSSDPELRDEMAYIIFARWIVRDAHYSPNELRDMITILTSNLQHGLGEVGTNSVLLRSFSVLTLSLILYYDIQRQFLSKDEIRALLDTVVSYILEEQDVRGYLPGTGWIHPVAHSADVFKFIARTPKVDGGEHLVILNAIAKKLTQPLPYVYIHDEDERLTLAVMEMLKRGMVSRVVFAGWLENFRIWKRAMPKDAAFDPTIHAPYMNIKNFVRSLYFSVQHYARKETSYEYLVQEALDVVRVMGVGTIYAE